MDIKLILEEIEKNYDKYKNGEIVEAMGNQHYSYRLLNDIISKVKKHSDCYFIARCRVFSNKLKNKNLEGVLLKEQEMLIEKKKEYSRLLYDEILQAIFILLCELDDVDYEDIKTYHCPKRFRNKCFTFNDIQ